MKGFDFLLVKGHIKIILHLLFYLQIGNIDIWTKPIMPKGSLAFAMVNFGVDGTPKRYVTQEFK